MAKSKKASSTKKPKSEEPVAVEDTHDNSNNAKTEDESEKATQENGELDINLKKKGKGKGGNTEESLAETNAKDEEESETLENEEGDDTETKKPAAKKAKSAKNAESKPASEPARKSSRTPTTVTKEESEEESFEVEELVGFRMNRGVPQFRVRWKGYSKSDDTWENEDSLNCPELLQKYKADHPIADPKNKKRSAKSPSTPPKKSKTEEDYEVEEIVGLRIIEGKKEFKVRWKGYKPSDDSWEPEKYLSCQDLIEKYLADHKDENEAEEEKIEKKPRPTGKATKGRSTRAK